MGRKSTSSNQLSNPVVSQTSSRTSNVAISMSSEPSTISEPSADWYSDRHSIFLLILLYTAQGIPMGLAFGSIPFLLKERGSSYADLATFSFASLPYSVKLLIAPIVDSFYSPSFGRRKSWIVPVQIIIAFTFSVLGAKIHQWVLEGDVNRLTPTFILILAMTATQDIAVDGWSLTMLKKENVSYASTCQSLGLSLGYFATFTVFLAFSNSQFCDKYVRPLLFFSSGSGPLVTLRSVLQSVGIFYIFLTLYIVFCKKELSDQEASKKNDESNSNTAEGSGAVRDHEERPSPSPSKSAMFNSIMSTYHDLWYVIRKPSVQSLVVCLLLAKVGFSAHDNVSSLKLLEFGFPKETMASMALFNAPVVLFGSIYTGRLVAKKSPVYVYLCGFLLRFVISLTGPFTVRYFSTCNRNVSPGFYLLILTLTNIYSFASECLMFVGIGAFFLNVSSSSVHVAGSYLTLLNTSSNMGGLWHKAIVLWLVDQLTIRADCKPANSTDLCPILFDGYYMLSVLFVPVAAFIGLYLRKSLTRLGNLPDSAWIAKAQVE